MSDSADNFGPQSTALAVDQAQDRARSVSSQILDMIGIKNGKVTESDPDVRPCTHNPDRLFSIAHPWSVYGVSEDTLRTGFQRLKEKLLQSDWRIVAYGPNSSKARTLELTADNEEYRFSVNVELRVSSPTAGAQKTPLILVNVVSGCFYAPESDR